MNWNSLLIRPTPMSWMGDARTPNVRLSVTRLGSPIPARPLANARRLKHPLEQYVFVAQANINDAQSQVPAKDVQVAAGRGVSNRTTFS